MTSLPDPLAHREAAHPIETLFLQRWSPRAFADRALSDADRDRLFEAARWAPSTYNEQEWRFRYAHRDGKHWATFFGLLAEANQVWCKRAALLGIVASKTTFAKNGKPNPVHELDAGLALENLFLQATTMKLVSHGMAGFDRDRARKELRMPADVEPHAMFAIGHPGTLESLPDDLRAIEKPSSRKPIAEIAGEGPFAG